jgi:hypothetical protein
VHFWNRGVIDGTFFSKNVWKKVARQIANFLAKMYGKPQKNLQKKKFWTNP